MRGTGSIRKIVQIEVRLFILLGVVVSIPLLIANHLLLKWSVGSVPGLTWLEGHYSPAGREIWWVIPAYILLVAVLSLGGVALNLALVRGDYVGGDHSGLNASQRVATAAFFVTLIAVVWGWISWDSLNAVTFAAFFANLLFLLAAIVFVWVSVAKQPRREELKKWQSLSMIGILAVSWTAGILWIAAKNS